MAKNDQLVLTGRSIHLCVDMQRLFSKDGPWATGDESGEDRPRSSGGACQPFSGSAKRMHL